jgi:chromate reductase
MVEAKSVYKVIGICGSLRKESTNLSALKLVGTLSDRIQLEIVNYEDVPLYNGDVEAKGIPDSVKALAAKIAAADGVYIASPEYNYSITGVLKNLIDWLSRI